MDNQVKHTSPVYLETLAELGISRHLGGNQATKQLISLCHIDQSKYVLDVGCGTGKSTCNLVKRTGCRVMGVDISVKMVEWARQRASREKLEGRVEFRQADAQNLPFENDHFDAIVCESVLVFVPDPHKALSEYIRVTKPGGYVGLNESGWLKPGASPELCALLTKNFGTSQLEPLTTWEQLVEGSDLHETLTQTYRLTPLGDLLNRARYFGLRDMVGNLKRIRALVRTDTPEAQEVKELLRMSRNQPKDMYTYFGYGIYTGRK